MKVIEHSVFGSLKYNYSWTKDYSLPLFGSVSSIELSVEGELEDEIENEQSIAFSKFEEQKESILKQAESAVLEYYLSIVDELRDMFGADADKLAPQISTIEEVSKLITAQNLIIPYQFSDDREVGLLFDCIWNDKGVGIKIVNEAIDEVGFQDIVL